VDIWQPEGTPDFDYPDFIVRYMILEGKPAPLGKEGYYGQYSNIDPIDGPCGLALDASDQLYVNDYHRSVLKVSFGSSTVIAGQGVDSTHPTGVAVNQASGDVYVDARTHVGVYDSSGAAVLDGGNPLQIGAGNLVDGYGIAVSSYPGTQGLIYVPDTGTDTVKIFDPAVSHSTPIDEIDGSETPPGEFVSLRDASIAIDRVSGEIYVVDNLEPRFAERPDAIVYVFDAAGNYEGHLLEKAVNGLPTGVAVDNSASPRYPAGTQGLVYVTSGNTSPGVIYNYTPDAATTVESGPAAFTVKVTVAGGGTGSVQSSASPSACASVCEESVPAGSEIALTARSEPGSSFGGWSGACAGSDPRCAIQVDEAASVRALFEPEAVADVPAGGESLPASSAGLPQPASTRAARPRRHRRHHRRAGHRLGRGHKGTKRDAGR